MIAPQFYKTQAEIVDNRSTYMLLVKGRRTGGTFALAYREFIVRIKNEVSRDLMFVSHTQRTANEFIDYLRGFFELIEQVADVIERDVDLDGKTITQTIVKMPNGSRIIAMPSTPSALRGFGGDVILDEFALHKDAEELYDAAQPLIMRGGRLTVLSTVKGKENLFWRMVVDARAYRDGKRESAGKELIPWSLIELPLSKAVEEGLVEQINTFAGTSLTRDEFLANMRRGCRTQDSYLQEYEGIPEEDHGTWLTYDLIHKCEHKHCPMPNAGLSELYTGGPCYAGVDVGRTKDLTVIWICELVGDVLWTRQLEEIHHADIKGGVPIPDQVRRINELLGHVKLVRVGVDYTGLGIGLGDGLVEKLGEHRVENITFTNANKEIIAVDLRECMEDGRMRIPEHDSVVNDLHRVKKLRTATGKTRLDAERVEDHADRFWAAGLAVHMAKTQGGEVGVFVV